ncbi:ADP-ribose pyrophosphatase [compost metagenome]
MGNASFIIQGVKIVTVHKEKLVVVKQSRNRSTQPTIELPGGRTNSNEDLVTGAIRELREETGLISNELIELGTFSIPKSPIVITLFFTDKIVGETLQELDVDEDIEVLYVDMQEAFMKIMNGEWPDTRLAMGLILARSRSLITCN